MGQEDLDQRAGAAGIAHDPAGRVPIPLVRGGERPAGLGLCQRRGPGQRAGLTDEDLEVVVERQRFEVPPEQPVMAPDDGPAVEVTVAASPDVRRRPTYRADGVVVLTNRHLERWSTRRSSTTAASNTSTGSGISSGASPSNPRGQWPGGR